MKKKIEDDYDQNKALKQEKQVEKEYTGKLAKFAKEANRKLAGKWVADEKNKVLYQVKEIKGYADKTSFTARPVNSIHHEFYEYCFDDIVNIDFHKDGITGNSYYVETSGYGEGIYLLDEPYNDYITYNDKIYTWDDLPTLTKEIGIRNIERTLEELE